MSRTIKEIVAEYNGLCEKHNVGRAVKKFRDKETAIIRLEALKTKLGIEYEVEDIDGPEKVEPKPEPKSESEHKAPTPSPEISRMFPKNPGKFRPAMEGMLIRYKMVTNDPETMRQHFIDRCVEAGIKKSTAGQQWRIPMDVLEQKFKEEK